MNPVVTFDIKDWSEKVALDKQQQALNALEEGQVLYFPNLSFQLYDQEKAFLSPDCVTKKDKNVSFDINNNRVRGSVLEGEKLYFIKTMMHRYAHTIQNFMSELLPFYTKNLKIARTSYRPVQISGRISSYRKDDSRLHVDAFPASPVHDKRILRVFSNVHPNAEERVWRVGDRFTYVADNFLEKLSPYNSTQAKLMKFLKITRSYRSAYDHYMLKLHHAMKADENYQKNAPQTEVRLPPGSTWMVYTDVVSHAAMSGQFAFEQTFYLPVRAMNNPHLSPLRILENKLNKKLVG